MEEESANWEEFEKIRAQQDEERVRALEEERAKIRSVSKTLVYWDIQNMHLPEEYDLKSFSLNISMAMGRVNYKGHISIVAFGDVSKIPSNIQQQLHHAEIEIKDVPGDHWWLNDEFKDEIEKNSQHANSLLITDDDDYDHTSHLVYEMIHPVYSILLGVTERPANTAFFSMAKHIWLWPELIRGGSPLSSDFVSNWLKLAIKEWHATFPDSDELSSEQDLDCSLSLEMCPEIRAREEEEEIRYWEEFDKIRDQQDKERVRALEVERAKIRSVSKTLVYWDIQNMHLPEEYDLKSLSLNISMAMDRVNYKGHISIVAFGDVSKIHSNIQQQLHHAEIEIKDVPGDHWWLNDEFKDEIEKNSQDANSLLITDDDDYDHTSHLVYEMIHPVYSILLGVTKRPANTAFFNNAKHIWLWPELIRGGSPLSSDCVSNWLKLAITEWYATFPDSDELSSEQDVDCSLSLEMCPEIRAREEEEEIRYWEEFDKIRDQQDKERVRALEVERAKIRSVSKTLVYWDIQNMHLPEEYDLKSLSLNISMAMDRVNYKGHISIVAFGDVSKIHSNIQQQLHHAEIEIKDVPGDHWWLNDEFKDEIEKNSQDANSLLITDDDDYDHTSHLVFEMIHPVYSILLGVTKRPANTAFFNNAKHIWLWPELIRGGSPLSSDCVSNWLKLAITEWYATFPDSDELSSEQDVDCSLSLEMCPEIRAREEEEDEVSSKGRILTFHCGRLMA